MYKFISSLRYQMQGRFRYFLWVWSKNSFILFISMFKYYHDFYGAGIGVWKESSEYRLLHYDPIVYFLVAVLTCFELSSCFFDKLAPEFLLHHLSVFYVAFLLFNLCIILMVPFIMVLR
eukprot:UN27029